MATFENRQDSTTPRGGATTHVGRKLSRPAEFRSNKCGSIFLARPWASVTIYYTIHGITAQACGSPGVVSLRNAFPIRTVRPASRTHANARTSKDVRGTARAKQGHPTGGVRTPNQRQCPDFGGHPRHREGGARALHQSQFLRGPLANSPKPRGGSGHRPNRNTRHQSLDSPFLDSSVFTSWITRPVCCCEPR